MNLINKSINKAIPKNMMEDLKQAYKQKLINGDDLKLIALSELKQCYNTIKIRLSIRSIDKYNNIIYRSTIDKILEDEYYTNNNIYKAFNTLKQVGYIGVCGRGYTFENPKIELTNNQYNRLVTLLFDILI